MDQTMELMDQVMELTELLSRVTNRSTVESTADNRTTSFPPITFLPPIINLIIEGQAAAGSVSKIRIIAGQTVKTFAAPSVTAMRAEEATLVLTVTTRMYWFTGYTHIHDLYD